MFDKAYRRLSLHGKCVSLSMKVFKETMKFLNWSGWTSKESSRDAGNVLLPPIELLRRWNAVVTALA